MVIICPANTHKNQCNYVFQTSKGTLTDTGDNYWGWSLGNLEDVNSYMNWVDQTSSMRPKVWPLETNCFQDCVDWPDQSTT